VRHHGDAARRCARRNGDTIQYSTMVTTADLTPLQGGPYSLEREDFNTPTPIPKYPNTPIPRSQSIDHCRFEVEDFAILYRYAAAAAPGSSTQRGTRVAGEEAFDSLGSFLGGLGRINAAQLASLYRIRDRLIDLRWNPRLTSTGQERQVLK
jgi:hypothetical protein